jgi:hypothetical protein
MKRLLSAGMFLALVLTFAPGASARRGAKPEWPEWAEKPRILGEARVGASVTADEGSPMFAGTPDDRRPGCRVVRSRSDDSYGCIVVEWVVNGAKRAEGRTFRIPADASSVEAVVTIYVKEFDQLGRPNGYSQGSQRTQTLTIPRTAAGCRPPVACDYFRDRIVAWRAQGRSWQWITEQREFAVWRQLGGDKRPA